MAEEEETKEEVPEENQETSKAAEPSSAAQKAKATIAVNAVTDALKRVKELEETFK